MENDNQVPLELLLDLETAQQSEQEAVRHFMRSVTPHPNPWQSPRRERPNVEPPENHEDLQKRYDVSHAAGRQRSAVREWIVASLAKGKTTASLANHARHNNPALASEIEEIARELGL